jgi:hypothetical protein
MRFSSRRILAVLSFGLLLLCCQLLHAQEAGYHDHDALSRRLAAVAREHPQRVAVRSLAKTRGERDVWLVTIGGSGADTRPAVLVVGGVDGARLVGSELALRFVEQIAADRSDSTRELLERTTFYVIPCASPDALESFFDKPRVARATNLTPRDDDRDGALDEDGYDDLDGNGIITQMRVRSPRGRFLADPLDERFLREADASRGERGVYELLSEGRDNDGDGSFNEDPPGGVDINHNFPFNYRAFSPAAGEHAASETESRALADACYDHQNIVAVFSFSSQSNLLQPWETRPEPGSGAHVIRSVREGDADEFARLAKLFSEITGQKKGPAYVKGEGSFVEWAYYHFGRVSLGAPGWWLELSPKADTARSETKGAKPGSAETPEHSAAADTLAWLDRNGSAGALVPWRRVTHPDFEGREVEVGGVAPYATSEPPASMLDSLGAMHTRYLLRLATLLPRVEIADVKTEPLGDGVTRVRMTIVNSGYLPTLLAMGETSRVPIDVKAEVRLASGQTIASGRRVQLLGPVAGNGGSKELVWVIAGSGDVRITIGGPMTGTLERTVALGR